MKLRNLYGGARAFSYIIFDNSDTAVAEKLLDELDEGGYRYWFNSQLAPSESELQEILSKLKTAAVTVLVLTGGILNDPLANSMIEYSVDKRTPFVVYAVDHSPEMTAYLNSLLERAKSAVVLREWEQSFSDSHAIQQALLHTKGITEKEAEGFYLKGLSAFESETPSTELFSEGMRNIMYAAGQEYGPALAFLGNFALEKARQGRESYLTAIKYYKAAVKLGNIDAIYSLGCMIADGEGFEPDYAIARPYISMAALKGIPDAQFRLADMLDKGLGVAQDKKEATVLYTKALEKGDRRSYLPLAYKYLIGETVNRDETIAAEYFAEAAEDGNIEAVLMLAKLYRDGVGVRKDALKSENNFRRAAEHEIAEAQYEYARILQDKGNYFEAFKWLTYAAMEREYGKSASPEILFAIGQCYGLGHGVEPDRQTAFLYYHKAALAGYEPAREAVAECYRRGVGVAINKRAAEYYSYGA